MKKETTAKEETTLVNKAQMKSSRKRMASRLRFKNRGQVPGFKWVTGKDGRPELKPNRAKIRQQLAIKLKHGLAVT